MRLTPPRPPGEDYYLACASFSSEAPVDGFWTYSKCFTGSWLSIHRWLRWFGPSRMQVRIYQGREQIRLVLAELRRQTALHRAMKTAQPALMKNHSTGPSKNAIGSVSALFNCYAAPLLGCWGWGRRGKG
jgi:hypothetical protein